MRSNIDTFGVFFIFYFHKKYFLLIEKIFFMVIAFGVGMQPLRGVW